MNSPGLVSQSMHAGLINVLVTGGTGFIGKAVIARLVDQPRYGKIYLLVRDRQGKSPAERVAKIVQTMFPRGRQADLLSRIQAVSGDLTLPGCGVAEDDVAALRGHIDQVLHVGASTDFGAPLAESRLNNVEGTRHALDLTLRLAQAGATPPRFDYVSTAYVAGREPGLVSEDDLVRGQPFSNNYEQSKYEAELLVRDYKKQLPVAIYRPSIVVGDSRSGYTPHFKVLYWPLVVLSKGFLPFFATNQKAHLDVVPVDYVADGIVALMQRDASLGETFHLTAGKGDEIRIRDFLHDSYRHAGIKKRPIIPFWLFNLIEATPLRRFFPDHFWAAAELATPYLSYLKGNGVRFDARQTAQVLRPLGIKPPRWDSYKREILTYCLASRWGRKIPMPEYIYYLPVSARKELQVPEPAAPMTAKTFAFPTPAG